MKCSNSQDQNYKGRFGSLRYEGNRYSQIHIWNGPIFSYLGPVKHVSWFFFWVGGGGVIFSDCYIESGRCFCIKQQNFNHIPS